MGPLLFVFADPTNDQTGFSAPFDASAIRREAPGASLATRRSTSMSTGRRLPAIPSTQHQSGSTST